MQGAFVASAIGAAGGLWIARRGSATVATAAAMTASAAAAAGTCLVAVRSKPTHAPAAESTNSDAIWLSQIQNEKLKLAADFSAMIDDVEHQFASQKEEMRQEMELEVHAQLEAGYRERMQAVEAIMHTMEDQMSAAEVSANVVAHTMRRPLHAGDTTTTDSTNAHAHNTEYLHKLAAEHMELIAHDAALGRENQQLHTALRELHAELNANLNLVRQYIADGAQTADTRMQAELANERQRLHAAYTAQRAALFRKFKTELLRTSRVAQVGRSKSPGKVRLPKMSRDHPRRVASADARGGLRDRAARAGHELALKEPREGLEPF